MEPDLGRLNNTQQHRKVVLVSVYGVNRPKPGSRGIFYIPIAPIPSLWALSQCRQLKEKYIRVKCDFFSLKDWVLTA